MTVQAVERRLRVLVTQHLVDVADLLPEVLHLLCRLHLEGGGEGGGGNGRPGAGASPGLGLAVTAPRLEE